MTINAETARIHAETVNARLNTLIARTAGTKAPEHVVNASITAAKAVAQDLIDNPLQVVEGMTAATANPAIFDRMMTEAMRTAGRAAMNA